MNFSMSALLKLGVSTALFGSLFFAQVVLAEDRTPTLQQPPQPSLNFYGLPGLIIELEIAKGSLFRATNINLSLTKEIKIKKPTRGKKLSLQEFEATSKKLYESFHSNKLKY